MAAGVFAEMIWNGSCNILTYHGLSKFGRNSGTSRMSKNENVGLHYMHWVTSLHPKLVEAMPSQSDAVWTGQLEKS